MTTPVTAFTGSGQQGGGICTLIARPLYGIAAGQRGLEHADHGVGGRDALYGNLGAIPQHNIKRLLGYSSIGHAGYMLMGVAAVNALGAGAVLFYLGQYAFTVLCAFLAIIATTAVTGSDEIPEFLGSWQALADTWAGVVFVDDVAGGHPAAERVFREIPIIRGGDRTSADGLALLRARGHRRGGGGHFAVLLSRRRARDLPAGGGGRVADQREHPDADCAVRMHGGDDRAGDFPTSTGRCVDNGCKGIWLALKSVHALKAKHAWTHNVES